MVGIGVEGNRGGRGLRLFGECQISYGWMLIVAMIACALSLMTIEQGRPSKPSCPRFLSKNERRNVTKTSSCHQADTAVYN